MDSKSGEKKMIKTDSKIEIYLSENIICCIENIPNFFQKSLKNWVYKTLKILHNNNLLSYNKEPSIHYDLDINSLESIELIWTHMDQWVAINYTMVNLKALAYARGKIYSWVIPSLKTSTIYSFLTSLLTMLFKYDPYESQQLDNFFDLERSQYYCTTQYHDYRRLKLHAFGIGYKFVNRILSIIQDNSMSDHAHFEDLNINQLEGIDRFYSLGIRELCDKLDALHWLYITLKNMEHPRYSPGQWIIDQIRNLYSPSSINFPEKIYRFKGKTYNCAYTNSSFWKEKDQEKILNDIIKSFINDEATKSQLWYHGTNASSAYSILHQIQRMNINVHDFGKTPGFYLGNSLSHVIEWSKIKTPRDQYGALLVFNVPEDLLNSYNYRKFYDLDQWKKLITDSRREKRLYCQNSDLINDVDKLDFVSGYVCENPRYICQSPVCKECLYSSNCRSRKYCECRCKEYICDVCKNMIPQSPNPYTNFSQLVAKSEQATLFLHSRICGVILLNPHYNQ
jgi:hypothetical protein